MSDSVRPHRQQPTRLLHPWDSPGKNTGVGCHFLLQCRKVKSESEVSCVRLFATPWTAAYQAPPSMGFSRQGCWSGVPLPSPKCPVYVQSFCLLCSGVKKLIFVSIRIIPQRTAWLLKRLHEKDVFSRARFGLRPSLEKD